MAFAGIDVSVLVEVLSEDVGCASAGDGAVD